MFLFNLGETSQLTICTGLGAQEIIKFLLRYTAAQEK
jgi:hypothetical protein